MGEAREYIWGESVKMCANTRKNCHFYAANLNTLEIIWGKRGEETILGMKMPPMSPCGATTGFDMHCMITK